MSQIKRILVIADAGMRETVGLHRAAQLAKRADARLFLLMCAFDAMIDMSHELAGREVQRLAKTQYLEQRQRWLDERAAALAGQGLRVDCEVLWTAEPHEALLARALELEPDLVIADLMPARKGAARMPMTTLDWRLARTCPAPLMFVRQDSAPLPRHVAIAIDASLDRQGAPHPLNERIAETAMKLAMFADADLHLVHTFPYRRPSFVVGVSADLRKLYQDVRSSSHDNFTRFADAHSIPADRRHWIDGGGEAATALVQFAQVEHIDLMVLGSSYHSMLSRLLLGSASEGVLSRASFDVLLVKPDSFADELKRHYNRPELQGRYAAAPAATEA